MSKNMKGVMNKEKFRHTKKMNRLKEKRFKAQTRSLSKDSGMSKLNKEDRAKIMKKRENRAMVREVAPYLSANIMAETASNSGNKSSNSYIVNYDSLITNGVMKPDDTTNSVTNTGSVLGG